MNEPHNEGLLLDSYGIYFVAFSGGKDSIACVLHLMEMGVPKDRIELHHHCVDGREGSTLMDWPCTEAYCIAFAKSMGLKIYMSWKDGGIEGEMLRENSLTRPTKWQDVDGTIKQKGGTTGKLSTRRMFPQVTASLSQRWCSAYVKIDIGSCVLRNSERFNNQRSLVVTGERAEESSARAKYNTFEPDRADGRVSKKQRHIDHWRPVHAWSEEEVWAIIKRHHILVHPAYRLGWGRLSCMTCIFGSKNQWASIKKIALRKFERIRDYEQEFGKTIHRTKSVAEQADTGTPYEAIEDEDELVNIAMSFEYSEPIRVRRWMLPAGAYAENAGPT